jgi:hypothetical protein
MDGAISVIAVSDGGFAVAGTTDFNESGREGDSSLWVIRLDAGFRKAWDHIYESPMSDFPTAIKQTRDGGLIVAVNSSGIIDNIHRSRAKLLKLDPGGGVQWAREFGITGSSDAGIYDIIQTADGGYLAAGDSMSAAWIARLDARGMVQWEKTYDGDNERFQAAAPSHDGGFFFTGMTFDRRKTSGVLVARTDAKGKLLWKKSFGNESWSDGRAVFPQPDGGALVHSMNLTLTQNNNLPSISLIRLGAKGEKISEKIIGDFYADGRIVPAPDGGFIVGGNEWAGQNAWGSLFKLDADLNVTWKNSYKQLFGYMMVAAAAPAPGGGYIAVGSGRFFDGGRGDDMVVFLTDSTGTVRPLGQEPLIAPDDSANDESEQCGTAHEAQK